MSDEIPIDTERKYLTDDILYHERSGYFFLCQISQRYSKVDNISFRINELVIMEFWADYYLAMAHLNRDNKKIRLIYQEVCQKIYNLLAKLKFEGVPA